MARTTHTHGHTLVKNYADNITYYLPDSLRKYYIILMAVFLMLLLENLVLEMHTNSKNDISSGPGKKKK